MSTNVLDDRFVTDQYAVPSRPRTSAALLVAGLLALSLALGLSIAVKTGPSSVATTSDTTDYPSGP